MPNPIHFLPERLRTIVWSVVALFWFVLFAYGTIKLLLLREWMSAFIAGGITLAFVVAMLRRWRKRQAKQESETAEARTGSRPIE